MPIVNAINIACPLDGLPLLLADKQYVCPQGHSFDVARQGYINLLPVQHKRSKHPGDSQEMITARGMLLDSGVYAPIATRLITLMRQFMTACRNTDMCLLDAGCGEGYYLVQLLESLQQEPLPNNVALIGLDISKPAILAAAKRSKQVTWLIASNKQPPLLPGSVDVIFCLFGFPVYTSFRSLLKPNGKIILVEAGPEHLLELRHIIYPTVTKAPPPDLTAATAAGFLLGEETQLTYRCTLNSSAQIMNLLYMTPHYFRANEAGRQAARQLDTVEITVEVIFRVLENSSV